MVLVYTFDKNKRLKQLNMKNNKYTVWVGSTEVNDNYLTKQQAENLAFEYEQQGYDDVIVEQIN
jgi:prophage maintenance system killer protein